MENRQMKVLLGVATISSIAIGTLIFTGGCESQKTSATQAPSHPMFATPATSAPTANAAPAIAVPTATPAPAVSPAAAPVTSPVITPASPESKVKELQHTVKKGETLAKIAKKFNISKQDLAKYNNLPPDKSLQTGSKIKIPPTKAK